MQPFNYRMNPAPGKGPFPNAPGTPWQDALLRAAGPSQCMALGSHLVSSGNRSLGRGHSGPEEGFPGVRARGQRQKPLSSLSLTWDMLTCSPAHRAPPGVPKAQSKGWEQGLGGRFPSSPVKAPSTPCKRASFSCSFRASACFRLAAQVGSGFSICLRPGAHVPLLFVLRNHMRPGWPKPWQLLVNTWISEEL